eukprot:4173604-Amphidinium_carterae.1
MAIAIPTRPPLGQLEGVLVALQGKPGQWKRNGGVNPSTVGPKVRKIEPATTLGLKLLQDQPANVKVRKSAGPVAQKAGAGHSTSPWRQPPTQLHSTAA